MRSGFIHAVKLEDFNAKTPRPKGAKLIFGQPD
jgi:hypothetical protein